MKVHEENKSKKNKDNKDFRSIETLFRNSLRANLELTSLADSKASVLISVNGFILTVIITASGLYLNNSNMIYPFITILLTSLVSILLATMAIRPRDKQQFMKKEYLKRFNSVAYFQDMSETSPNDYVHSVREILKNKQEVHEHIIKHIHILGAEIKVKYSWLKRAYTSFGLGLSLSAIMMIVSLFNNRAIVVQPNTQFKHIYEPSGAVTLKDGKVLLVEDESKKSLQVISVDKNGKVEELGEPKMSQKIKMSLKHKVRDIEGVAINEHNQLYLITSHSTNKKDKHKKAREQIVRLNYEHGKVSNFKHYHGLLNALQELNPALNNSFSKRKKQINIEALTWDRDSNSLLIGLRSPLIDGKAIVVPLKNPNDIFDKHENPKLAKPILLDLYGDGIRAMSWDKKREGYWIVSGSVGKRKGDFSLWFWDKKRNLLTISHEDVDIGYAEGVTALKDNALFIVQDNGSVSTHGANYKIIKE